MKMGHTDSISDLVIFSSDRGFRDALPLLENIYKVYKPESLEAGESQLSTIKANKSRLLNLCRWVVEVDNGRFKLQFKLFRQEYFNVASSLLMDDFKICAAI
ncbi:hypothetical protein PYW08_006564 [Mythimna loreyi]|uniref:Uncharacterized protein n=1 Tax=Mythimna loreyi TaxID=667449 RepID=A0ACC2QPZ2_9NEOP|nr:hypothetical protein PYW08_006564 [Mythimna loreyi]